MRRAQVMFHISALLFAWLEFSWPVALAMTLALLMFIYGMYRYWCDTRLLPPCATDTATYLLF